MSILQSVNLPSVFVGLSAFSGQGHVARATALHHFLRSDFTLHFFCGAFEKQELEERGIENVHEIPVLRIEDPDVPFFSAIGKIALFWKNSSLASIKEVAEQTHPIGVVSDFEPLTARFAKQAKIRLISCDRQSHFSYFKHPEFKSYARKMWEIQACYLPKPDLTIISSFYGSPAPLTDEKVKVVSSFLRPELAELLPRSDGFALAFIREEYLLRYLKSIQWEVKVYGLGARETVGNLQFFEENSERFLQDLSTCHFLVSHGGSTLIGEALFFGKSIYVIPETGNVEHLMNGMYLEKMNCGRVCLLKDLTLPKFIRETNGLYKIQRVDVNGAREAARLIREAL